ncbi:MAG: hypothetical protein KAH72_10325 [Flavobacteriaceae bacterium]|nr:hypothetical protein [Flavobacteriaceae bacterium]
MASIKNLKKDINNVLSNIIEECYICQLTNDDKISAKADKVIDEAIEVFDDLIVKLNLKNVDNKKKHFQSIITDLDSKTTKLLKKLDKIRA